MNFRRGGPGAPGGGRGGPGGGRGRGGFGKPPLFDSSPGKFKGFRDDARPSPVSSFTSDASLAGARVFVGSLPTDHPRFSKAVLEDKFSPFGKIIGISVLKGFGFVQFEDEMSAMDAMRVLDGSELLGNRIDVNPAKLNSKDDTRHPGPQPPFGGDRNTFRDRSPIRGREPDYYDDREPFPPERDWNRNRDERGYFPGDVPEREHELPPRLPERGRPFDEGPRPMPGPYGRDLGPAPDLPNDVEIIATVKSIPVREYAEDIEKRLRSKGLRVDILFPHQDIPIPRVLADFASKGTLFGIVISPANEEHRSVTLAILFGAQEEHRNMPVDDALILLHSSFRRHRNSVSDSGKVIDRKVQIGEDAHPPNIQVLVNFLQENRPLTVLEYNRIINYLEEKRDRQSRLELGEDGAGLNPGVAGNVLAGSAINSFGFGAAKASALDPQAELQQRILNILNSASVGGAAAGASPAPVPAPVPHPEASHQNTATGVWGSGDVSSTGGGAQLRDLGLQRNIGSWAPGGNSNLFPGSGAAQNFGRRF